MTFSSFCVTTSDEAECQCSRSHRCQERSRIHRRVVVVFIEKYGGEFVFPQIQKKSKRVREEVSGVCCKD